MGGVFRQDYSAAAIRSGAGTGGRTGGTNGGAAGSFPPDDGAGTGKTGPCKPLDPLRLLERLARLTLEYRDAQDRAMAAKYAQEPSPDAPDAAWIQYRNLKREARPLEQVWKDAHSRWCDLLIARRADLGAACGSVGAFLRSASDIELLASGPVIRGWLNDETPGSADAGAIDAAFRLMAAAPALHSEATVLRCLASSPRFQSMTVAQAMAELANNGCGHDGGAALAAAAGGAV